MTNQQMITAITNAIATDANLMLVMRYAIGNTVAEMDATHLQALCTLLGIDYASTPSS